METKKCSKCEEVKAFSEFHKQKSNKGGYRSQCKYCRSTNKHRRIEIESLAQRKFKTCSKCLIIKPFEDFYHDKRHKDGLMSLCKDCGKKEVEKYRDSLEGKKYYKEYLKKYRDKYQEKIKVERHLYYAENKQYLRQCQKEAVNNLVDWYVKENIHSHLGIHKKDITQDMIELKRAIITAKRELKKHKQVSA